MPGTRDGFVDRRTKHDLGMPSAKESAILVYDLVHLHWTAPLFEATQNDGCNGTHRAMVAIYHSQ